MNKALYFAIAFLIFLNLKSFAQDIEKVKPEPSDSFVAIINISPNNSNKIVDGIIHHVREGKTGLKYIGFCSTKSCAVFKTTSKNYPSLTKGVCAYLQNSFGPDKIVGYETIAIEAFWYGCQFYTEQEYQYFKTTYGR